MSVYVAHIVFCSHRVKIMKDNVPNSLVVSSEMSVASSFPCCHSLLNVFQ